MRNFFAKINTPYLWAIIVEVILVFLAEKLFSSVIENVPKVFLMAKYIPLFLIMAVSTIIVLTYLADGNRIEDTIIALREEYSWAKLKVFPKILQILVSVFFIILQWKSLEINSYWGIYVQLTIYFLVLARRHDNRIENHLLILEDMKKARKYSPTRFLIGCYRMRLYGFAINLIGADVFIYLAFHIGKAYNVEWRIFDLPCLYLFFILASNLLSLPLMLPGYYYSRKQ